MVLGSTALSAHVWPLSGYGSAIHVQDEIDRKLSRHSPRVLSFDSFYRGSSALTKTLKSKEQGIRTKTQIGYRRHSPRVLSFGLFR